MTVKQQYPQTVGDMMPAQTTGYSTFLPSQLRSNGGTALGSPMLSLPTLLCKRLPFTSTCAHTTTQIVYAILFATTIGKGLGRSDTTLVDRSQLMNANKYRTTDAQKHQYGVILSTRDTGFSAISSCVAQHLLERPSMPQCI
jgi:hypothetical protein